ncbi:tRNA (adenosine(37)-N6)-threonylcarbamoyltransferase complex dimerization subunit type 1 TsaB [Saccharospirillum salsuginis]|uniref:tRNA threonylcarbamoyladenosine biosynthesis protein TsaB n=1 Tax=Saccharospirillum salsuginis TaxID=418750 RepID=A0A918KI64_9GAMM|nr:tRNA (adenosine(37)-N6)-threonylcarbamoyltransferase complex dimerization subunit type 1 TsaB [Saccharospirillum salsuginis]GGX64462.1 tRNA threonylcarbamoyladenosine biosynthesis protein TsaB [Saccharospirillum salsuginis]
MPRILAIDTTADVCSLALLSADGLLTFHEPLPRQHARQVLPQLDRLMSEAGWSKRSIDFVVYGRGPGSFTGIRIAAGVAQGIALGADCGVVPVSTLQTLAFECAAGDDKEIWTALDARMRELYFARYRKNEDGVPELIGHEQLCIPMALPEPDPNAVLSGNGWLTDYDFSQAWQGRLASASIDETLPNAGYGARLAERLVRDDDSLVLPPEQALPVYLRDKVTWDKKPKVGS